MNLAKRLIEGVKMIALFGAIALVVWSMPEHGGAHAQHRATGSTAIGNQTSDKESVRRESDTAPPGMQ